jgi:acyl-CoA reductase-like NAD-dependent aldehyde dehydrogenase
VGGRLRGASDGATFLSVNPATEETLAEVALASATDVDAAVAAARQAFSSGSWSRATPRQRKRVLLHLADVVERHREELALLETLDTGVPLAQTRSRHLTRTLDNLRYFAELPEHAGGELIASQDSHLNLVSREPVGVIAILCPWNAPLALSSMRIAAALAFGNSVVVKPAEQAPLTSSRLVELLAETDLPPGVWNLVQGPASPTGEALVAHPGVDAIGLTGGTATGRAVMAAAARAPKPVSLELGGKSASLVFADADRERTLDGVLLGIFSNNGEQCLAGSRILVEASVYEPFLEAFVARAERIRVGEPLAPDTEVGPLVSRRHLERVLGFVERGRSEGARLCAGGDRPRELPRGFYLRPTVLADAPRAGCLMQEEVFGPVAAVASFRTEDEAVELANDTRYGLAAYCWSADLERAHRVARRLRAGTVWVNTPLFRDVRAPFGGVGDSGFGREGGRYGLEFYTVTKNVCLALRPPAVSKLGTQ